MTEVANNHLEHRAGSFEHICACLNEYLSARFRLGMLIHLYFGYKDKELMSKGNTGKYY